MNGHNLTVIIYDDNQDCYLALFPNFAEREPAPPSPNSIPFNEWGPFESIVRANPSGRVMPGRYFMFGETPLGSPDGGQFLQNVFSVAMGFR